MYCTSIQHEILILCSNFYRAVIVIKTTFGKISNSRTHLYVRFFFNVNTSHINNNVTKLELII